MLSPRTYILSTLAVVGVTWWLYTGQIRAAEQRGYDRAQLEQLENGLVQQEEFRRREAAWNAQWEDVQKNVAQDRENARLAGLAADSRYFRLRESIATEAANSAALAKSAGITVPRGASSWMVLQEILGRYREVAGDADRYTDTIREARGWAEIVKQGNK